MQTKGRNRTVSKMSPRLDSDGRYIILAVEMDLALYPLPERIKGLGHVLALLWGLGADGPITVSPDRGFDHFDGTAGTFDFCSGTRRHGIGLNGKALGYFTPAEDFHAAFLRGTKPILHQYRGRNFCPGVKYLF